MKAICPECRQLVNLTSSFGKIRWETHCIVHPSASSPVTNLNVITNTTTVTWCDVGFKHVTRVICAECKLAVDVINGYDEQWIYYHNLFDGRVVPHFSGGKSELCPGSHFDLRFDDLRTMEALEK